MRISQAFAAAVLTLLSAAGWCADAPAAAVQAPVAVSAGAPAASPVAVLSGNQVVQILDQTVEWYRTLGTQQQSSSQPSDLLIYYANQQTANQVMGLAFDIARANAELLSSDASAQSTAASNNSAAQDAVPTKLKAQKLAVQAEIVAHKLQGSVGADAPAKLAELQGELDMINARLNLLDNMEQFVSASNSSTESVNALKSHIDAIAASIPASVALTPSATATATTAASKPSTSTAASSSPEQTGIWDLATRVLRLQTKGKTIDAIGHSTLDLEKTFHAISAAPLERLRALSAQSDALATQADAARGAALKSIRDQLDRLAWLFQQTSNIWIPLSKEGVLLEQYRHNLTNWHDAVRRAYGDALEELGIRLAILIGMLALVFAAGEIWRRLVVRYTQELRRRYQLLLLQKLTLWAVVILVVALTFVSEISTFATFAGLITAGLAVAMQSVLLSMVGYFFLIGKYGLRVGDRVQIGTVTGEVISLGLVRMHLMELNAQGPLGATGRIVAFANSIVFQSSNGLFRQMPGVDFVWHEATLSLPAGKDYASIKAELLSALNMIINEHDAELTRQTKQIEMTAVGATITRPVPQVQLRFAASGAEALVRYPVQLQHEAETDERVTREIFKIVAASK